MHFIFPKFYLPQILEHEHNFLATFCIAQLHVPHFHLRPHQIDIYHPFSYVIIYVKVKEGNLVYISLLYPFQALTSITLKILFTTISPSSRMHSKLISFY